MAETDEKQIQVRFKTPNERLAVPDTILSVQQNLGPDKLNVLVKSLITDVDKVPEFDFFLLDDLLRTSLGEFVRNRDDITTENTIDILYVERKVPPEPKTSVNHDDWVAGVDVAIEGLVLSACYDGTVSIWDSHNFERKLQIPAHSGPVTDVAFIKVDGAKNATFASVSHDQTVALHRYNSSQNAIDCVNVGKGHARSVHCVSVDPSTRFIATGSFDASLKIWGSNLAEMEEDGESDSKKAKANDGAQSEGEKAKKSPTRTPISTLVGHKECVSGVTWLESSNELVTSSWDHTLRVWDMETSTLTSELVGNKAFFGLSYSPEKRMLLTAACERSVRMYDPRSKDGLLVKSAFASHTGWITSVDWCKSSDQTFVSGSHDSLLKMWDVRACKTPLYDLKGHADQVMCCSWNDPAIIVSGGADNNLKIFKSNLTPAIK